MNNQIMFVDASAKEEIDALRMQEYALASGFQVDLSTLRWKVSDDESFVMAARKEGQIISTMRGEVIDDLALLEHKLECPWSFPKIQFPVLLLSRAATLSPFRSLGLNLVLRYWFLRFAMERNIEFVVGTFVSGSPRENTLREMGYQFFENKLGWQQSTYRSLRPVNVVMLNLRTEGKKAMDYCLNRAPKSIDDFPYHGDFPQLRMVNTI